MSFILPRKLKQGFKKVIFALILFYVMITASLYFIQDKMLFQPSILPLDHVFEFQHNFEEVFLNAEDGAVINAIHFKADNPKGIILYFHGNAGDLQRWGQLTEFIVDLSYDVFVMDYRTYGKSSGTLTEETLYTDAIMCFNYIKKDYNEDQIIVYGRSLGTGIATYVASTSQPQQLILETPYYSIVDVAERRFPFIPVKKFMNYKLPTYKFIQDVNCPILMIHGTSDYTVPYNSARELYKSSPQDQTQFVTIEGGGHNDLMTYESYHKIIKKVLK